MKHLAAYLLLVQGGNTSPSAADIKGVLETVGIEADEERLSTLLKELEGKNIDELITEGSSKLSSVPSGGGAASSGAAAGGAAAGGAAEEKAEEKKEEEKEESDDDMVSSTFSALHSAYIFRASVFSIKQSLVRLCALTTRRKHGACTYSAHPRIAKSYVEIAKLKYST